MMSAPSVSVRWIASASITTRCVPGARRSAPGSARGSGPRRRRTAARRRGRRGSPGAPPGPRAAMRRGTSPCAGSRRSSRIEVREERQISSSSDRTTPIRIPWMIPKKRIPSARAHEEQPVGPVDRVVAPPLGERDQAQHRVDHDRRERRARQLLEEAGEDEHREQDQDGVDQRRDLGALPRGVGDRGLREAAVGGEPADEPGRPAGECPGRSAPGRRRSRSGACGPSRAPRPATPSTPTNTIESAPTSSAPAWPPSMSGRPTENRPVGTSPVTATPWSARSSAVETAIASTTTSSIRGQRGRNRRMTSRSPSEPAPTASVARLVSGIASIVFHSSSAYEPPPAATPSSACELVDDDADREAEHEAREDRLGEERRHPAHPQQAEREVDDAGGQRERRRVADGLTRCRAPTPRRAA